MNTSSPLLKTDNGRNFLRVVIGRLTSQFGTQISGFAITIWIYQQTDSLSFFGLLIFLYALPKLIISPFAGKWVDKYDRRKVILLSEMSAFVIIALLLLMHWQNWLNLGILGVFTVAIASVSVVQVVVLAAATGQLLPEENRMSGNAIIQIGFAVNQMLAPVLAGFLVYRYGLNVVLMIHLLLLTIAFVTLMGVRFIPINDDNNKTNDESSWQAFKLGLSHVLQKRTLLALALFTLVTNFVLTAAEVLFTPLVLSYETPVILGRLMALAGVGIFIGGVMAMMLAKTRRKIQLLIMAQTINGICLVLFGLEHAVWLWAICLIVMFAAIAFSAACNQTIWQNRTPVNIQGRVFAVKEMITTAIVPLAYLMSPIITDTGIKSLLKQVTWLQNVAAAGEGQAIALMFILLGIILLFFCSVIGLGGFLHRNDEHQDSAKTHPQPK